MRLYSPELMSEGKLIDYQVERGAKLMQMLGGYAVRDHEYALLRVQGAEKRTRLQPGRRVRFLSPFSTYELVRINQQVNYLRFALEADTAGMLGFADETTVLQTVRCSVRLGFRIADAHRLVVTNNIQSDAGFVREMTDLCSAEFLKLARHPLPSQTGQTLGTLFEFMLLPLGTSVESPVGQPPQLMLKLRSEETLLAMLAVRMSALGVTPIEVDILDVKMPEAVRALMTDLVATRSAQLLEAEATVLEEARARTRLVTKVAETKAALMDAFAAKVRDIDYFYGALARYGLDAKSAMLLRTLAGVAGGGEGRSGSEGSRDPVDGLIKLYSLDYLRRVFDPTGKQTGKLAQELGLPEDLQKSLSAEQGEAVSDWVGEEFRKLLDKLYFEQEKIDGPKYKELLDHFEKPARLTTEGEDKHAPRDGSAPAEGDSQQADGDSAH